MKNTLILLSALFFMTSCKTGKSTDSANFTFEPANEKAILVPNDRSSCSDFYTWEVALGSPETVGSAVLASSVKGFSASWNNMRVKWTDTRTLSIAFVQVEFESSLIEGGEFSQFLEPKEISALLDISMSLVLQPGFEVNTGDKASANTLGIVNCGLIIGDLKPAANANGTARGYIRIAGTATDASGSEEFIRESVPITLQIEDF